MKKRNVMTDRKRKHASLMEKKSQTSKEEKSISVDDGENENKNINDNYNQMGLASSSSIPSLASKATAKMLLNPKAITFKGKTKSNIDDNNNDNNNSNNNGNKIVSNIIMSMDNKKGNPNSSSIEILERPVISYVSMITEALASAPNGRMILGDIYKYIMEKWPYFKESSMGWKNSVRHNLSLNRSFHKEQRITEDGKVMKTKGTWWRMSTLEEIEECLDKERMKEQESTLEGEKGLKADPSLGIHGRIKILSGGERYMAIPRSNSMNGSNVMMRNGCNNGNVHANNLNVPNGDGDNTLLLPLRPSSTFNGGGVAKLPILKPRPLEYGSKGLISGTDGATLPFLSVMMSPSILMNNVNGNGDNGIFSGLPMETSLQPSILPDGLACSSSSLSGKNNLKSGNNNSNNNNNNSSLSPMLYWFASPVLSKLSPRLEDLIVKKSNNDGVGNDNNSGIKSGNQPFKSSPLGMEEMSSQLLNTADDIRTPPTRYCTI